MMVRITKNGKVKSVSKTAFHNYYENSGWVIDGYDSKSGGEIPHKESVNPEPENDTVEEVEEVIDEDEWDDAMLDDEVEKPLSEMTRNELIEKASSMGINTNNMKTNQIREAIKKAQ